MTTTRDKPEITYVEPGAIINITVAPVYFNIASVSRKPSRRQSALD